MNNLSQRDIFWNRIYELAKKDRNIVVLTADMGAPALDQIRKDLPGQFINVGIAEQNAIIVAAGLALTGKKVFTYAIAPFITVRCLEQIRVMCAIMKIPITMVGVGSGFGYEDSGPTHHVIEDIAMLRSMPNIKINNITDNIMAAAVADISVNESVANCLRIHRQLLPTVYTKPHDFNLGLCELKKGNDLYIVTTGSMTHTALKIVNKLENNKSRIGVIDVYTFPINQKLFLNTIKKAKKLVCLEENFLPGGLGSAISEVLCDYNFLIPLKRIGLSHSNGYCYQYGGQEIIRSYYGIDDSSLEKQIYHFFNKKEI